MPFLSHGKSYLTQNNFQFKDINVAQDQQAAQEMVQNQTDGSTSY